MHAIKVSAIVPVYRGADTLREALCSILTQNIEGLETIVLDDGSPDNSLQIANEVARQHPDKTIRILSHPNMGLAATLNRGISLAAGCYIARQDQDDIVLPGRLAKQVAFLDHHPSIAMIGTWAQIYQGRIPSQRYHRHPANDETLKLELMFDNPFVHSSMMVRADALRQTGGYSEEKARQPPEDYELWSRIARQYSIANLPEVLTIYRELPGSMSRSADSPFTNNVVCISAENLFHLLEPYSSWRDCIELAALYHKRGLASSTSLLSKSKAKNMLYTVATIIAGPQFEWTDEFKTSYRRISAHIDRCFLETLIPTTLMTAALRIKKFISRNKP